MQELNRPPESSIATARCLREEIRPRALSPSPSERFGGDGASRYPLWTWSRWNEGGACSLAYTVLEKKTQKKKHRWRDRSVVQCHLCSIVIVITLCLKGNHGFKHGADETFADGHSATDCPRDRKVWDFTLLCPAMRMMRLRPMRLFSSFCPPPPPPLLFRSSRFLHEVHINCSEEVLQRFHRGGQPVVLRGQVLLHHASRDVRLLTEDRVSNAACRLRGTPRVM